MWFQLCNKQAKMKIAAPYWLRLWMLVILRQAQYTKHRRAGIAWLFNDNTNSGKASAELCVRFYILNMESFIHPLFQHLNHLTKDLLQTRVTLQNLLASFVSVLFWYLPVYQYRHVHLIFSFVQHSAPHQII